MVKERVGKRSERGTGIKRMGEGEKEKREGERREKGGKREGEVKGKK